MDKLLQQIAETEEWLCEHPDADWIARHDMIKKLALLKKRKEVIEQFDNEQIAKN